MHSKRLVATIACAFITATGSGAAFAGNANLVQNGGFESGSGLGQIDSVVSGTGWTNTGSNNFNFILDTTADDALSGFGGGFPSVYSPGANTNIFFWGPDNGVNNGFTGSPDGGKLLGGDGGYATGTVTQAITGLTVGQQYTLSFQWAGAQFTDVSGDYWVGWDVGFGGESFSVGGPGAAVPSRGFHHWHHTLGGPTEIDKNFAAMLPCIDHVFGTFYLPKDHWPAAYGTPTPVASSLTGQLTDPLLPARQHANQRAKASD